MAKIEQTNNDKNAAEILEETLGVSTIHISMYSHLTATKH